MLTQMKQKAIMATRLLCAVTLLAGLISLAAPLHWLADLLANLRVQIVVGGTVAMLFALFAGQYRMATAVIGCLAVVVGLMSGELLPVTQTNNRKDADIFRLMTINVLSSNQNHGAVIGEILGSDPDAVAVLELTNELQQTLDVALSNRYPHSVERGDAAGNFGIALYSKHPLTAVELFRLNEQIDSIAADCHGWRLYATHPLPPIGRRQFRSRNEHLDLLARHVHRYRGQHPDVSVAVMGDFNLTPWSPLFRRFRDATGLRRAKVGFGLQPTWYAKGSWFPLGLVLDHIFVPETAVCLSQQVGPDIGSDHRSVTVDVCRVSR